MSLLLLLRTQAATQLRCIVLLNGTLKVMPTVPPYGLRVIVGTEGYKVAAAGGKSLVYDTATFSIRQERSGETIITP